jgi:hypothetical protein
VATAIRSTSALIVGVLTSSTANLRKQMLGMCWQGDSGLCPVGMQTVGCQELIPDSLDEVPHYVATRCGRHQACGRQT